MADDISHAVGDHSTSRKHDQASDDGSEHGAGWFTPDILDVNLSVEDIARSASDDYDISNFDDLPSNSHATNPWNALAVARMARRLATPFESPIGSVRNQRGSEEGHHQVDARPRKRRRRGRSLETGPGERRESRASSIASDSAGSKNGAGGKSDTYSKTVMQPRKASSYHSDEPSFHGYFGPALPHPVISPDQMPSLLDTHYVLTARLVRDDYPSKRGGRRVIKTLQQFGGLEASSPDNRSLCSRNSVAHYLPSETLKRPHWEPPILDYRKFDEGGSMYDSLHRHPETKPEDWYDYTDAEIEVELLGDYQDWIRPHHAGAANNGDEDRERFYAGLQQELNIDRMEAESKFEDIKERLYEEKKRVPPRRGLPERRVQKQFDDVRKMWQTIDSSDSGWDEEEWNMFGGDGKDNETLGARPPLTETNLRRLHETFANQRREATDGESMQLTSQRSLDASMISETYDAPPILAPTTDPQKRSLRGPNMDPAHIEPPMTSSRAVDISGGSTLLLYGPGFPCLFNWANCTAHFKAYREWATHMDTYHICEEEYWVCRAGECAYEDANYGRVYSTDRNLEQHLIFNHFESLIFHKTEQGRRQRQQGHRDAIKRSPPKVLDCNIHCATYRCVASFRGDYAWEHFILHIWQHWLKNEGLDINAGDSSLRDWAIKSGVVEVDYRHIRSHLKHKVRSNHRQSRAGLPALEDQQPGRATEPWG